MNIRRFFALLAVVAVIAYVYVAFSGGREGDRAVTDYKGIEYVIDGQAVTLSGVAAEDGLVTSYFGNDLIADLDGDGRDDVAFIVTRSGVGSGTFFYVVAALSTDEGYVGSDGYFLGDRVAPQGINVSPNPRHKNVIVANYADRAAGQSFTTSPSVGKSAYLKIDPKTTRWGIVEPDFEGEAR